MMKTPSFFIGCIPGTFPVAKKYASMQVRV